MNGWTCRLPVCLALLLCAGCGSGPSDPALATRSLTYEPRSFSLSSGECDPAGRLPCANFSVTYPEFDGGPADALNAVVAEMISTAGLEATAHEFLRGWEQVHAEFPDAASTQRWFSERTVAVVHEDPELLTLRLHDTSYTGGAHPIDLVRYSSYDLDDGHRLSLDDLLAPGYRDRLNEIAERRFREVREIPADADLFALGFQFKDASFAVNDNYGVTDDGLVFYFNAYEVASYADGPTEMRLGWEDLGDLRRRRQR